MSKPIIHFENDWLCIYYLPQVPLSDYFSPEQSKSIDVYKIFPQAGAIIVADDHTDKEIKGHGLIFANLPPNTAIEMSMADCLAITVIDKKTRAVGILHLGWLGLYSGFIKAFLIRFLHHTEAKQDDLLIFIGPGICGQCFTLSGFKGWLRIGLFFFSRWRAFIKRNKKSFSFDILEALQGDLESQGFRESQINSFDQCTYENPDFASHRRDGAKRKLTNLAVIETK